MVGALGLSSIFGTLALRAPTSNDDDDDHPSPPPAHHPAIVDDDLFFRAAIRPPNLAWVM